MDEKAKEVYSKEPPRPDPITEENREWMLNYDTKAKAYRDYILENADYYVWTQNGYERKYK